MKNLLFTFFCFILTATSQNLKDDGTPYFVPQRANILFTLQNTRPFYVNFSNELPYITSLNEFFSIYYSNSIFGSNIISTLSNYNGKTVICSNGFFTFNDSLKIIDQCGTFIQNNQVEREVDLNSPPPISWMKNFPNTIDWKKWFFIAWLNPQSSINIPLDNCSFLTFYSLWQYYELYLYNNHIMLPQHESSYYYADNAIQSHSNNGSLMYKKNTYINKNLQKGTLRFFVNETQGITNMLNGVQHRNKKDYWVIYHKLFTDYFSVHLVRSDGLLGGEIQSKVGIDYTKPYRFGNYKTNFESFEHGLPSNNIKVSPNGTYLVQTQVFGERVDTSTKKFIGWSDRFIGDGNDNDRDNNPTFDMYEKRPFLLFKFDNSTGKITDEINMNRTAHSMEFSPNSRYLYITSIDGMYVYDLKDWDRAKIVASEKKFDEFGVWSTVYMGPDGRLWGMNYMNDTLLCIPNPNDFDNIKIEKYCVLDLPSNSPEANITLSKMMKNFMFFPPMPNLLHHYPMNEYFSKIKFEILGKKKYCVGDTIILNAKTENYDGGMDAYWTKPNGMKVISSDFKLFNATSLDSGWYKYNLESECDGSVVNDSVYIEIINLQPTLTSTQNNFCKGDSAVISLDKDYEKIIWSTGEITKDIVVRTAGVYSATVTEGECSNTASLEIFVNPLPEIDVKAPNGLLICDGGSVEIEIEADPNISIQWSDNSRVRKRTFNQSGTFTITAKDLITGCELTKEIVISDMNEIQADILGNPTFCDGESTTLTLDPVGKTYLWNTGETTRSIEVSESGNYSATITSEAGCELVASKEITKYPLPDFEILGETIICENPVALYPNKDFANYEWNTGANSKTITITEAGNYWLRVTDENGCETTKSVEIKQANPELNLSTNNINFGEILFGSTKTQTITADRDVIITKNTTKFNAYTNNKDINIIFNPTNIGEYIDTLIVETEGDCKATDTIYITGVCKAEILASVSNAEGYPNNNISNKINLELQQQIPLPIDFNYNLTLNINQDAIYITDNTTYSYANGKLVIDIADYLNKSDYQTQIKDINSRINLARNHDNPITISNFTTDNEFLIPLRKDGNITIYELIENYTPANIQTLNRTTIILNTYESGTYKIEISDLTGKVITKQTQTTKNSEQIKYNYELSTGTYIIKITEPGKIQTIKVIFIE